MSWWLKDLTPKINDDSLGRALNELQQAAITELFASIAAQAVAVFGIDSDYSHVNTSSLSVTGEYDSDYTQSVAEKYETVKITHGSSKEQRPDLRQVVLTLITAQVSAIPLCLEVLDGNSSDKTSFRATLSAYCQQLESGEAAPRFVMDSAAYSRENLEVWQAINWLTRVPETLAEVKDLICSVSNDEMRLISSSSYRIYPVTSHYADLAQRWLLVYSEQAYQQEFERLSKQLRQAETTASSALKS